MKKESSLTSIQKALEKEKLTPIAADNLKRWLTNEEFSEFHETLYSMIKNEEFDELNDCFYTVIPFGTGGRRGPMGVGPNRINLRTISESAQAVANYLSRINAQENKKTAGELSAVIAYDTRNYSREFAVRTAEILAGNGISVYIFEDFRTTPELSFAVRKLQANVGVVISASHNPPTDNGFKVYWEDGGQILPPHDQNIIDEVTQASRLMELKRLALEEAQSQGLVNWIGDEIDQKYFSAVCHEAVRTKEDAHVLYTPLHGTGISSVLPVLQRFGYQVDVVEEQKKPDGDFPGVENHIPNPEKPEALELAVAKAKELEADVVLATDPDGDRLGVAVPLTADKKEWTTLTGNQIASLLTYFVLEQLQQADALPLDGLVVKTLVTTDLMTDICDSFDVSITGNLMVGFKYIAGIIKKNPKRFIFGAEESHGSLKGSYTRDKDATVAALLMAQLTGYLKKKRQTPYQFLDELYKKYGYYKNIGDATYLRGAKGKQQIEQIMEEFRANPPRKISGMEVVEVHDYLSKEIYDLSSGERRPLKDAPKFEGNVLVFMLSEDRRTHVAVRPSGTEPKIKYYISAYSEVDKTATEDALTKAKKTADVLATAIAQDSIHKSKRMIGKV